MFPNKHYKIPFVRECVALLQLYYSQKERHRQIALQVLPDVSWCREIYCIHQFSHNINVNSLFVLFCVSFCVCYFSTLKSLNIVFRSTTNLP